MQKIVIDAFCGELGIPITTMFKYEVEVEEQGDVAQFLSQKLDFPDVDFIRKRLVCFDLKEAKEAVSINGYSHDIGLVIVTQGKLQVFFANTYRGSLPNATFGFGKHSHWPNICLRRIFGYFTSLVRFCLANFCPKNRTNNRK